MLPNSDCYPVRKMSRPPAHSTPQALLEDLERPPLRDFVIAGCYLRRPQFSRDKFTRLIEVDDRNVGYFISHQRFDTTWQRRSWSKSVRRPPGLIPVDLTYCTSRRQTRNKRLDSDPDCQSCPTLVYWAARVGDPLGRDRHHRQKEYSGTPTLVPGQLSGKTQHPTRLWPQLRAQILFASTHRSAEHPSLH